VCESVVEGCASVADTGHLRVDQWLMGWVRRRWLGLKIGWSRVKEGESSGCVKFIVVLRA
jgi:hypothetical protein